MKKNEIKKFTKDQALKNLDKLKKDLFNLRFQKTNGQLTNPSKISQTKKNISRMKTLIGRKKVPKKILNGIVVSDKPNKTITVMVERKYQHPTLKKVVKVRKKFSAHDENNKFKNGDKVKIIECRPYSKTKKFEVLGDNKWYRYKLNYL